METNNLLTTRYAVGFARHIKTLKMNYPNPNVTARRTLDCHKNNFRFLSEMLLNNLKLCLKSYKCTRSLWFLVALKNGEKNGYFGEPKDKLIGLCLVVKIPKMALLELFSKYKRRILPVEKYSKLGELVWLFICFNWLSLRKSIYCHDRIQSSFHLMRTSSNSTHRI